MQSERRSELCDFAELISSLSVGEIVKEAKILPCSNGDQEIENKGL